MSYNALNVKYEGKFTLFNKRWDNLMNFSIILGTNEDYSNFGYFRQNLTYMMYDAFLGEL